jgi:hypothetical protein
LAVERVYPPMAVAEVPGASGGDALVMENGTTFWSAVRAARGHASEGRVVRYRWIAFGVGRQLSAIIPSLLDHRPDAIDYFGDLDANGLAIAADGARACQRHGLPALGPASILYAALIERGRPQTAASEMRWPDGGLAWIGPDLAAAIRKRLGTRSWLAQEWVGQEYLTSHAEWCDRTPQPD